ncbi:MAG: DUF4317 domain-containing protein, partial [Lachnospiraceae bacterium]
MVRKEVAEIKKQFSNERCTISRICGCYIDGEKNQKVKFNNLFLSLPEEDIFKYYEIFKKTLSGTIGKNLHNLEFPLEAEFSEGGQKFLYDLRRSELKDEALLNKFYDKVMENYEYGENYLILLIHANYDVPGKGKDDLEMEDASETVYQYLLCSICPVNLSKEALGYDAEHNRFQNRQRDWVVEMPDAGFLFPAYHDRAADIHAMLYYSRKPEEIQNSFIMQFLGCEPPMSAGGQKETFQALIEESLGTACEYEVVKNIHEKLSEKVEESKDAEEPLELGKMEMKRLLEDCGVRETQLEQFEEQFEEIAGEQGKLLATNLIKNKMEIKTPNIMIQVKPECADLIETRVIDGRRCLVI